MMTVIKRGDSPPILFLSNLEPPTANFQKGPPARVIHFLCSENYLFRPPHYLGFHCFHKVSAAAGEDVFLNDELHSGFDFYGGQVLPGLGDGQGLPAAGLIAEGKVQGFLHGCGSPPFPKGLPCPGGYWIKWR